MGRSKLNSKGKIIYKALTDFDFNHKEFTLGINKEQDYLKLKEKIRAKDNQVGEVQKDRLIEHGKKNWIWWNTWVERKIKSKTQNWNIKSIEIIRRW